MNLPGNCGAVPDAAHSPGLSGYIMEEGDQWTEDQNEIPLARTEMVIPDHEIEPYARWIPPMVHRGWGCMREGTLA